MRRTPSISTDRRTNWPASKPSQAALGREDERDAVGGLAAHRDHAGAHLGGGEAGGDQLEVAVDAVGPGEGIEQRPGGETAERCGERRHGICRDQVSEQLYAQNVRYGQ